MRLNVQEMIITLIHIHVSIVATCIVSQPQHITDINGPTHICESMTKRLRKRMHCSIRLNLANAMQIVMQILM